MLFELNNAHSVEVIRTVIAQARKKKETIGLTSGCFDLVHFHHVNFFTRCRRSCDHLIVGVDSDELVREFKGPKRPVIPDSQRVLMVDALKPVSFAFIMGRVDDFAEAAKLFRPDFIFKNQSFKGKEQQIAGRQYARKIVIVLDQVGYSSTTEIIRTVSGRG